MNKTIGELLAASSASMVASHKKVVADLPEPDLRNEGFFLGVAYAADKFKEVSGYSIVGPGSVVGPKELAAAAKALLAKIREQDDGTNLDYHDLPGFYAWEDCTEEGREQWRDVTRVTLEAAGIVVADEVVEVGAGWGALAICNEGLELVHEGGTDRQENIVNPGDKLYIERAAERATVTGCDKED